MCRRWERGGWSGCLVCSKWIIILFSTRCSFGAPSAGEDVQRRVTALPHGCSNACRLVAPPFHLLILLCGPGRRGRFDESLASALRAYSGRGRCVCVSSSLFLKRRNEELSLGKIYRQVRSGGRASGWPSELREVFQGQQM
ncbi:hypothetical protein EJ06DRAFT_172926 [Trichodelitschia bisporula]|uniref:Secreted protein n=1 Tax=Trichodelitschia bisporula TaxID=703511 RepID=A0A6G1HM28_9PEZI|nr:hypothetical protein EJ06DRAFT_172926 [Trichodelitschia bisporula]